MASAGATLALVAAGPVAFGSEGAIRRPDEAAPAGILRQQWKRRQQWKPRQRRLP